MRECGQAEFGDGRLAQRLMTTVTALAEHPNGSLPEAAGRWSRLKGMYRFFDNARVGADRILLSHRKATVGRIKGHRVVLAVQDTTTLSFSTHDEAEDLGPIGSDYTRGFFLHSSLALDTTGMPLGLLTARFWARETGEPQKPRDPESRRWAETVHEVREIVPRDTRVVVIGDRESDIFPVFAQAQADGCDVLVRATHNRKLQGEWPDLAAAAASAPLLGTTEMVLPRGRERQERVATLALHAKEIVLPPPAAHRGRYPDPVHLSVVCAYELEPPQGETPVGWILLTTLDVPSAHEAAAFVRWYTFRWRIERFHYTLKSGCNIERLQLQTRRRLENAIAVYCIVAWRLLHLTYAARETPDAPCTTVFSDAEWKAIYIGIHKKSLLKGASLPSEPPTLSTAVIWLARLGGFLARKGDGMPGVKVLWRGFRRLEEILVIWNVAHPS